MRLPSRFQAESIAWECYYREVLSQARSVLVIRSRCHAIPEAKTPFRRYEASTGKNVISFHCVLHCRPGKQIHVDACSARHFNDDLALIRVRELHVA